MNFTSKIVSLIKPEVDAYAHCDVPCGIYDPKDAQLAAETVEKMMTLMDGVDAGSK